MITKPTHESILTGFILDFADFRLSRTERASFLELMDNSTDIRISAEGGRSVKQLLNQLPEKKSRPGFSQRMVAAFAMELEAEAQTANKNRISNRQTTAS